MNPITNEELTGTPDDDGSPGHWCQQWSCQTEPELGDQAVMGEDGRRLIGNRRTANTSGVRGVDERDGESKFWCCPYSGHQERRVRTVMRYITRFRIWFGCMTEKINALSFGRRLIQRLRKGFI